MSSILIFYHFLLFPVRVFVNFGGAHHRIPRCTHIHLHILTQHWLSHTEILFTFIYVYVYVCLYIVAICKTVPIFIYRFHIWWLFLVLTLALCPCFSSVWLNDVASLFCSVLFLFSIFFFCFIRFGWLFHLPTNGEMHTNEHSCIWHWTSVLRRYILTCYLCSARYVVAWTPSFDTPSQPPQITERNHNVGG